MNVLKTTYKLVSTFDWIFHILAGHKDKYIVSDKFELGQIQPWTLELAAHDQLKEFFTYSRTFQNILNTCWLSGERSLPFGLLVLDFFIFELQKLPAGNGLCIKSKYILECLPYYLDLYS